MSVCAVKKIISIEQRMTFHRIMEKCEVADGKKQQMLTNRFSMVQLDGWLIYMSILVHSTGGDLLLSSSSPTLMSQRFTASSFFVRSARSHFGCRCAGVRSLYFL